MLASSLHMQFSRETAGAATRRAEDSQFHRMAAADGHDFAIRELGYDLKPIAL
jgi:hypothetical protein